MTSRIPMSDPLWDVGHSYFYLSRPGTIWLMMPFSSVYPGEGYNLLMSTMMPVFLIGLVLLTKSWSGTTMLASVATLLFVPIALDAQFFLNDSVVAASFSIWGLVLLAASQRALPVILAGMLLSFAILCRLDQVLLIPLFIVLCAIGAPSLRAAARCIAFVMGGALAIHGAAYFVDPEAANLFHRISVVSSADTLWARGGGDLAGQILRDIAAFLIAFGVGLPAIWLGYKIVTVKFRDGAAEGPLSQERLFPLLLMTYPVAIYAITVGKYYDPRGFLTILPFMTTAIALAFEKFVIGPLANLKLAAQSDLIKLVVILGAFLIPGVPLLSASGKVPFETENAVPTVTGRVWHSQDWEPWQNAFHNREARVDKWLAAGLDETDKPSIVLSATWTSDRTLQNALVTAEFEVAPHALMTCQNHVVLYRHLNGSEIYHIRSHIPFLPNVVENSAALFVHSAKDCLLSFPSEQRFSLEHFGASVGYSILDLDMTRVLGGLFYISDDDIAALNSAAQETLLQYAKRTKGNPATIAQDLLAQADAALNKATAD